MIDNKFISDVLCLLLLVLFVILDFRSRRKYDEDGNFIGYYDFDDNDCDCDFD